MATVNLTFDVTKAAITRTDSEIVASGSINTFLCGFDFCETWDGLVKFARFEGAGGIIDVPIESVLNGGADSCVVPWEVLEAPYFTIAVYGTLSSDVMLTTTKEQVKVYQSLNFIGESPLPATPALIERYEGMAQDAANAAENANEAAENANEAAFNANEAAEDCINTLAGWQNHNIAVLGVDDYVTVQGTSGNWKYRKWNSGIAECWLDNSFRGGFTDEEWWGSLYAQSISRIRYPFQFFGIPTELCGGAANVPSILMHGSDNDALQTGLYAFLSKYKDLNDNTRNFHFSLYVIGRWKP